MPPRPSFQAVWAARAGPRPVAAPPCRARSAARLAASACSQVRLQPIPEEFHRPRSGAPAAVVPEDISAPSVRVNGTELPRVGTALA